MFNIMQYMDMHLFYGNVYTKINDRSGFYFAILAGPCSNYKIKNRKFFVQQSSHQYIPHQLQATHMSPYTWKPQITLSVVYMCFHDDRACDSSLLHALQLGSEFREVKIP